MNPHYLFSFPGSLKVVNLLLFVNHSFLQVRESPVPSDSLLTVDLKSGSKINIGTNGVTLDKFFEGNLKATKSLDLGNSKHTLDALILTACSVTACAMLVDQEHNQPFFLSLSLSLSPQMLSFAFV